MCRTIELRRADGEALRLFYDWMKRQFHADELKSLAHIREMIGRGVYSACGFWDGDTLMAYALLGNTRDRRAFLLDYFAVLPPYQGQGWGGQFLTRLNEAVPGEMLLLEVAQPEFMPEDEREFGRRRLAFYEKNGCRYTKDAVNLFGVHYVIMGMPRREGGSLCGAKEALDEMYRSFMTEELYRENVHFQGEARE